jgi:Cys-rich protein (TIGR01571 family)
MTTMSSAAVSEEPTASPSKERKDVQGEEMWTYEFFGCFSDWKLFLATFCCPCYTIGRNAEHFNEDCLTIGGTFMLGLGLGFGPLLRWRLRHEKNIRGSMLSDVLAHFLCPCCSLIQENKEIYGYQGCHVGEKVPLSIAIARQ